MLLPFELLHQITQDVDTRTLKNMAKAHPHFIPLYDSIMWRHVVLRYRFTWPGRLYDSDVAQRPNEPKGRHVVVTMANDKEVAKVIGQKTPYIRKLTIRGDFYVTEYTQQIAQVIDAIQVNCKELKRINVVTVLNRHQSTEPLFETLLKTAGCEVVCHFSVPCPGLTDFYFTQNPLPQLGQNCKALTLFNENSGRRPVPIEPVLQLPSTVKTLTLTAAWLLNNYHHMFRRAEVQQLSLKNCKLMASQAVKTDNLHDLITIPAVTRLILNNNDNALITRLDLPELMRLEICGPQMPLPAAMTKLLSRVEELEIHAFYPATPEVVALCPNVKVLILHLTRTVYCPMFTLLPQSALANVESVYLENLSFIDDKEYLETIRYMARSFAKLKNLYFAFTDDRGVGTFEHTTLFNKQLLQWGDLDTDNHSQNFASSPDSDSTENDDQDDDQDEVIEPFKEFCLHANSHDIIYRIADLGNI